MVIFLVEFVVNFESIDFCDVYLMMRKLIGIRLKLFVVWYGVFRNWNMLVVEDILSKIVVDR